MKGAGEEEEDILNQLCRFYPSLDDLACFLQSPFKCINDNHSTLFRMFVKMPVALVMLLRSSLQNLHRQLFLVRTQTPHRHEKPPLSPPFVTRQDIPVKQRLSRSSTAVDHVSLQQTLSKQPLIIMKRPRQHRKLAPIPALLLFHFQRDVGEPSHDARGVVREAVVDDVDLADGASARFEGETDVPVGLEAATEDCESLDATSAG